MARKKGENGGTRPAKRVWTKRGYSVAARSPGIVEPGRMVVDPHSFVVEATVWRSLSTASRFTKCDFNSVGSGAAAASLPFREEEPFLPAIARRGVWRCAEDARRKMEQGERIVRKKETEKLLLALPRLLWRP